MYFPKQHRLCFILLLGLTAGFIPAATSDNAAVNSLDGDKRPKLGQSEPAPQNTTPSREGNDQGAANPVVSHEMPVNSPDVESTKSNLVAMDNAPSPNATVNLIRRLVKKGVLSEEDAKDLIEQAENDAAVARRQAAEARQAAAQAAAAAAATKNNLFADAPILPPASSPELGSDDEVRVTYIPETVKAELRDQLRQEVMNQAREEGWAAPRAMPEWAPRFRFLGDVRVRYERDMYPKGNDNTGAFPNFNAINTGPPFDITGTQFSPQYNVDQDRQRFRIRARFGTEVDLADGFIAGFRLGTGESNTPVTENQSLGLANQGQGGNFSKYAIWLDRAFIKFEAGGEAGKDFQIGFGRFDNPFFTVSRVIWEDEIGFDGLALTGKYQILKGFTPFITLGAFPVFNTDLNFSSIQPAKFKSTDKYLYAGQAGFEWRLNKDFNLKLGAAYYYFDHVEGKLSNPFVPITSSDQGNTDDTRPSFAQKGNTYMALRNIIPSVLNNFGTTNQFQYFGLATPFHELALDARLNYDRYEPFRITLLGQYVKNLAFNKNTVAAIAVNNRGATSTGGTGSFEGGDTAWFTGLRIGTAGLNKRGDWNLGVSYRYVESDSVVDGFTDSDFGNGGTNLKGYVIYGNYALNQRVWLGLSWMSATAIAGPPFKANTFMFDINARF